MLLPRNVMIAMELQNIMLAVALAKVYIVSPSILDHAELKCVWMEEPTETAVKNVLSVASFKILQSVNFSHFIIKFPKIKSACNKITIFPVLHHDTMLRLEDNVVAECNGEIHTKVYFFLNYIANELN